MHNMVSYNSHYLSKCMTQINNTGIIPYQHKRSIKRAESEQQETRGNLLLTLPLTGYVNSGQCDELSVSQVPQYLEIRKYVPF